MVIAGGVDFHNGIQDYIMFCSTYALSHKGKCFSFSDEADGIALGEGMAAVVLKRLEDAQADGDKIYGVIEGIAGSSDGKSLGLTAPRKEGQKFALNRAYQRAGISPKEIGLVEAHGTGTVVGDRTELTALEEVYQWAGSSVKQATLGTVKTQIGHTKCAAGVASLIKSVLATQYGVLPPTLNISKPNAKYDNNRSPFMLNNRAIPWQRDTRLAGVSSFGFGGTNYHAVVGNQGLAENLDQMTANLRSHELFSFSAKDVASALAAVQKLIDFIENSTIPLSLASLAWSQFNDNDASLPPQIAIVASDVDDLRKKIISSSSTKSSHWWRLF
jgi:acyl transferase domain-containing protein